MTNEVIIEKEGPVARLILNRPDKHNALSFAGLDQLVQPVHQLDVRVASELAEDGRSLDPLVRDRVELAEQRDTTDFTHG